MGHLATPHRSWACKTLRLNPVVPPSQKPCTMVPIFHWARRAFQEHYIYYIYIYNSCLHSTYLAMCQSFSKVKVLVDDDLHFGVHCLELFLKNRSLFVAIRNANDLLPHATERDSAGHGSPQAQPTGRHDMISSFSKLRLLCRKMLRKVIRIRNHSSW